MNGLVDGRVYDYNEQQGTPDVCINQNKMNGSEMLKWDGWMDVYTCHDGV